MIDTRLRSKRKSYQSAAQKMKRESRLDDRAWIEFEKACLKFYGRLYGKQVFAWIREGEHDFKLACTKLLGIEPFPWQIAAWDALMEHRYVPAMLANSAGKTVGYELIILIAGFYRAWSTPEWANSQYRMIHLAPDETQALEVHTKIGQTLRDESPEQMIRVPGGWESRPCLLTPFIQKEKHDGGLHDGYSFLDGSSIVTMRPTAFKAKGTDGTNPALVTWDELRHERNFQQVLDTIIMPRFLRVSFGRLLMFFTPLEASVELVSAFNRGVSGLPQDRDWFSITTTDLREANPRIDDETIARAKRNIGARYLPMVTGGKAIQAAGSKFSQASVEACTYGTTEPEWLADLLTVRRRAMDRCVPCKTGTRHPGHFVGCADCATGKPHHRLKGFLDPASSAAGADSIVATIWDLDPPRFPEIWADVLYIEELPEGTKVQRVGAHVTIMSLITHDEVGFDANTALGHNVIDQLVDFGTLEDILKSKHIEPDLKAALTRMRDDLADEPIVVPCDHNSKREKDEDLDYFGGLLDLEKWSCPFHLLTKSQIINYVRKDKGIRQDFVMTQVGAAWLSKGELPDMFAELTSRKRGGVKGKDGGADDDYAGLGLGDDAYFGLPAEAGATMFAHDALGANEGR